MFGDLRLYETYGKIQKSVRSGIPTAVFGVQQSEKIFLTRGLGSGFVFFVTKDFVSAKSVAGNLAGFEYLPFADDVLLYKRNAAGSVYSEINRVLFLAYSGLIRGVVASADALARKYPKREIFFGNCFDIEQGKDYSVKDIARRLVRNGYKRTPLVSAVGEFSLRGDILDVFSPLYDKPVRTEFFGDSAESVRFFDPEEHISTGETSVFTVIPVSEIVEADEGAALELAEDEVRRSKGLSPDAAERLSSVISDIRRDGATAWLVPFTASDPIGSYFPKGATVIMDEPGLISERLDAIYDDHIRRCGYLAERGEITVRGSETLVDKETAIAAMLSADKKLSFQLLTAKTFFRPSATVSVSSSAVRSYRGSVENLASDVRNWAANGYKVGIFAGDGEKAQRIFAALYSEGLSAEISDDGECSLVNPTIIGLPFEGGFVNHSDKLALIGDDRIFTPSQKTRGRLRKTARQAFFAVEAGDYVVHEVHGVGLCVGTTTMKGEYGEKDYIVVKYRNNDTLYVPVEASDLLSKYGGGETKPRLSALGGGEFERTKAKVRAGLKELAIDLVGLYKERLKPRGFVYKEDAFLTESFEEAFPYTETDDQLRCIEEIRKDLSTDRIMDRLLVGDVGFGKTEVAMRAIFRVVSNGKQAIVLAPTTILSQQHYELMKARFEPFGLKTACLNRFRSAGEQKDIIAKVERGEVNVIVGTHRLLNKNIKYKDAGILVLDEEHRFGVEHKEILKTVNTNIDVLSMSATPIPRTLHMALSGIRDISTITTPPKDRLPVESYVVEDSPALIRDVILRETARDGQVFVVYNRVESIEAFSQRMRDIVPEASIKIAHGQMNEHELERTVYAFSRKEFDVLISTTIIENGIDIPNANTLIVYDADNLGLSQLYQLRGRVGRSSRLGFAYFVYRGTLTAVAYKRLASIMENTELGSGFKIAMKDLEIRGAGNVLGKEQHGHMAKVGTETYMKLLGEVLSEVKGEPVVRDVKATMEADVDAHVPSDYIGELSQRMEFYQRMASVTGRKDRLALERELKDVYGAVPPAVSNLLDLAELKAAASKLGVKDVVIKKKLFALKFASMEDIGKEGVQYALKLFGKRAVLAVSEGGEIMIKLEFPGKSERYAMTALKAFCETALSVGVNGVAGDNSPSSITKK